MARLGARRSVLITREERSNPSFEARLAAARKSLMDLLEKGCKRLVEIMGPPAARLEALARAVGS